MKLNEWNRIREERLSKKTSRPLSEKQIQAGVTSNPGDYYFCVFTHQEYYSKFVDGNFVTEPRVCAIICPRKYFDERACCYDSHVLGIVKIPGFAEDMESMISPSASMPDLEAKEMHELLLDIGLVWSTKFANFVNNHDPGCDTAYFPENI